MKQRMGRPPKSGDSPMTDRLYLRVEPTEKDAYAKASEIAGMEQSDWIRSTLNAAAKRLLRSDPKRQ